MVKQYRLLSDAMLDGAKLRPPTCKEYVSSKGATCALAAMTHAITGDPKMADPNEYANAFSWAFLPDAQRSLLKRLEESPILDCHGFECSTEVPVENLIIHLADSHGWSRTKIAAWLATIEAKLGMVEIVSDEQNGLASTATPAIKKDAEVGTIASV